MAANAITVLKMTTMNSSVAVAPTMQAVDTDTGAYLDVSKLDGSRVIFIIERTATNVAGDSLTGVKVKDGDSKAAFSGYTQGDLTIYAGSTARAASGPFEFIGPFETARFKDSDGYIDLTCTFATNTAKIGAIII